jgi:hypothetical protein
MKFYANIQSGKVAMSLEQESLWAQHLNTYKSTDLIQIEVKKYRAPKSRNQLGAWFGLFANMVCAEFDSRGWDTSYVFTLDKPTGIGIKPDLLKDWMYSLCPVYADGKPIRMSDDAMTTEKMAEFFDNCRNFAASQWSIFVPEPDPKWKEKVNTKEIG